MKNKTHPYDILPDVHGQLDKLTALLDKLGYLPHENHYRHPAGRKVIFLGDYIDRGPKIREVLHLVRNMMDAGEALAIAGNHELNAVHYATPRVGGGHLREHNEKNVKQHAATLAAFAGREDEWADWIAWMKHLPMFLEIDGLRAVHAAWADEKIEFLRGKALTDEDFLHATGTKGTREFAAIEHLLKGPELRLPDGVTFRDKEKIERKDVRVRWWEIEKAETIGDLVMPVKMRKLKVPVTEEHRRKLANYPKDAPPVFVGHYWMPPTAAKKPRAHNVAVLDYSAGLGDAPLVGYRWNGERKLTAGNFVTATF